MVKELLRIIEITNPHRVQQNTSFFWQTFEAAECKTESIQWNQHQHQPMHHDDKLSKRKDLEIQTLERMRQLKCWMDRIHRRGRRQRVVCRVVCRRFHRRGSRVRRHYHRRGRQ